MLSNIFPGIKRKCFNFVNAFEKLSLSDGDEIFGLNIFFQTIAAADMQP